MFHPGFIPEPAATFAKNISYRSFFHTAATITLPVVLYKCDLLFSYQKKRTEVAVVGPRPVMISDKDIRMVEDRATAFAGKDIFDLFPP